MAAFKSHTFSFWGKTRKFQMRADLPRSHKLWRFVCRVGGGGMGAVGVQCCNMYICEGEQKKSSSPCDPICNLLSC